MKKFNEYKKLFFIGVAGSGMSALAQYTAASGITTNGSDRFFKNGTYNEMREKLEAAGIHCFPQDGSGLSQDTDAVIVSTAIEETVQEVAHARKFKIPVLKRSDLLALVAESKKTIAIAGTSGKSTTTGMLFHILSSTGFDPGIISGAGLISLIEQGKIGNAFLGNGDWLVIEADESDGSITQYTPHTGVLLNIEKDHQEINRLMELFSIFKQHTKKLFIVNRSHPLAQTFSQDAAQDFGVIKNCGAGFITSNFSQDGFISNFTINEVPFSLHQPGQHNMENALAATCVAAQMGISLKAISIALKNYKGIYRRHQVIGEKNGILLIDDYAHNPVKCAAAIRACHALGNKVIAWFQPHGYGPTRFLKNEFVYEIGQALRDKDEIWMSEIFYAGGSAEKNISSQDLINELKAMNKNAYFVANRNDFVNVARVHFEEKTIVLLMGARDPSLEDFAKNVFDAL